MSFNHVTRDNLVLFKRSLRTIWPKVRSSHADEAIAAYCGFRTYAALCAALPSEPDFLNFEPQPQALIKRLEAFGHNLLPGDIARVQRLFESEIIGRIGDGFRRMVSQTANDNRPV